MRIGYFLEDIGQARFILALCRRILSEQGDFQTTLEEDVRNSSGGKASVDREFERFLRDYSRGPNARFDIVVVAKDTDCQGESVVRNQLQNVVNRASYAGIVTFAVPDPYVEVWYLADPQAIQRAVNSTATSRIPGHRCQPHLYKAELMGIFRQAGIAPPLGGVEYADEIVALIDLYAASQNAPSLGRFIQDLRNALKTISMS